MNNLPESSSFSTSPTHGSTPVTSHQENLPIGNILVVDDTPNNLRFLSKTLTDQGYKVRSVINGSMALTVAKAASPDLILLDIKMPEMDGYEVCRRLKADERTQEIPIIFLSALHETLDKVKAFKLGGVDYITKPFQFEEVLIRVEHQLDLQRAKAKIQALNAELELRVRRRTAQLEQEIAIRQKTQEQLLHVALHDSLTGLPNRNLFMQRLEHILHRAQQGEDYLFAVLLIDCDRFNLVNDSLGHDVGDQLLIAITRRLETCLRPGHTLARLGGDEFTVLLEEIKSIKDAIAMAKQFQTEMQLPFQLDRHEVFINVSMGIVLGHKHYIQSEHLLRDADAAMYQAKAQGKACYQIFDPAMHNRVLTLLKLENDLRHAITRQEFLVYYQPIVSLETQSIRGFEALVRWQHPKQGLLPPSQFIAAAEEAGLIIPIDLWVLRQACTQLQQWKEHNLVPTQLTIGVNLSVKQFAQPNLIQQIDTVLQNTGMAGHHLKLEITESAIMNNAESAVTICEQLRERQIQLSVDDFGTGYSSLSYLHRFPVDTLKIDRSFITRLGENGENLEIIQTIVTLAHSLGMSAIAEGIETYSQLNQLQKLGCELGQGYFFSRPLDKRSTETLLSEQFSNPDTMI